MQNFKYYISAFIAFMLWGFFSLALKPIAYVPSFDILFYRITFSAIIIVSFTLLFRRKIFLKDFYLFKNLPKKEKQKGIYLTLIGGVLLGINWFLFIYVVNQINVQSASFAYLVCPIITTFLATIILKERLRKSQWIAVLISFIGCLFCFISNPNNLFFALIVAFTYAFYLISQRSNIYFDKLNVLTVQIILIFILSLPYYFVNGFQYSSKSVVLHVHFSNSNLVYIGSIIHEFVRVKRRAGIKCRSYVIYKSANCVCAGNLLL